MRAQLEALGARLRYGGLMPRALAAWAGSDRLSALPVLLGSTSAREPTAASRLLALFVAGDDVPLDMLGDIDDLHRHDLVDVRDGRVHARVSLLPLGAALLVCDRLDASDGLDVVCWPDDSSYHLALSLPPGRHRRWLDLGCGSAFAPLLRPELAHEILAADLNVRATRYARLGRDLSGVRHIEVAESDLGDAVPAAWRRSCDLVSCNAPIPYPGDAPYRARWLATDATFFERLFAHARTFAAEGGLVVVHGVLDALAAVVEQLPGERVIVAYTPDDMRGFGIAWWRPDGEPRLVTGRRLLTAWRPHLTYDDRLAALS